MDKRIVEIQGIKMEIDTREVKTIESYKVGTLVKLLKKEYSDYKSYPGVIVGFDEFKAHPTIIIAYLKAEYSSATIEFCYFNSESKDTEICAAKDAVIPFEKGRVTELMDRMILVKEKELEDLNLKKEYFFKHFNRYFEEVLVTA